MLEEEDEQARFGNQESDCLTCTKFLLSGLDLERFQCVPLCFCIILIADTSPHRRKVGAIAALHGPDNIPPGVIEQRTTIRRQLAKFRELQQVYQPGLGITPLSPDDDVLKIPLFLPSSLPPNARSKCPPRLVAMEKDLRLGQCYDALASLRVHLHSRSRLLKDKYVNVRNQGPNTKSRELVNSVASRISVAADRYTVAYSALCELDTDPTAQWRAELHTLNAADIRGVSEPSLPDHPDPERASAVLARMLLGGGAYPEGNHVPSWIWRGAPTSDGAVGGYNEGLYPPCGHFTSDLFYFQHINSNGPNCTPEVNVGRRRSNCSRKRCDGPSSSSSGSPPFGWLRPR